MLSLFGVMPRGRGGGVWGSDLPDTQCFVLSAQSLWSRQLLPLIQEESLYEHPDF